MDASATKSGSNIAEKLGASTGMWAVFWIGLHYVILRGASADPRMAADAYVSAILDQRMRWEMATALCLMGGLMIVWFMGSLAGRLRTIEGGAGRLTSIALGTGVLWGSVWMLGAMFNSAAILLATVYQNPEGARLAGVLSRELALILTPSIAFMLTLAVTFVAFRHGGFPKAYRYVTGALCPIILALALADWYGPGNLAGIILVVAFGWLALTSALLVPAAGEPAHR